MTKALITGGGGQVALALVRRCPASVQAIACQRASLDITDETAVALVIAQQRPDVVINCAAYTAVDRAENEPDLARAINDRGVANIAAACSSTNARLIHISTDFVFDGKSSIPYRPEAPTNPISVYGRTKRDGEGHALALADSVVLRTSWVYSADSANFVKTMLRLLKERDRLMVVDDQVGSPTHAQGLADAIWAILLADVSGIYHYTDAGVCSWYDFACAIAHEAKSFGLIEEPASVVPIPSSTYSQSARRPAFSVLDKQSTWDILGRASRHWQDELRTVIQNWKDQKS
ncbi:dTDP-4-dehydrorhamnose reductase [Croceicoccus naphthovorans]|uniref:dTDP-4-dehydrorhamnose reductase n=1 Tax=Croceicoccus naphthovorans TaxID=1348774 RepID=A0A0G3XF66_9SPHN|nr:dTDP-4-dehydrorhamnose reductase [Croceicoccus naphthovorans]AKM10155.1 dTDP-4-dehydrorhamnose reductase [Croceicoccus naphthovorans]MBB3990617.1 dTDP-4-dehydrorhamnose reductase [Croceicoccus naphthovorans]